MTDSLQPERTDIMSRRKAMKLASRGKRFGAACIDMIIPATSCFIAIVALSVMIVREMMYNPGFGYGYGYGYGFGYGYSAGPSAGIVTAFIISSIISLAYVIIQLIFFNKSRTIGKAALGLQVVSSNDGEPVGFWKMLFREWFVKSASASVFLLGFIWILIDDKNRGWHDKILDTYVVDLKESAALNASEPAPEPVYVRESPAAPAGRPTPKSSPAPVPAPETIQGIVETEDRGAEIMDSALEVADVVVMAAKKAADKPEPAEPDYDNVNAVTSEISEGAAEE